MTSIHIIYPGPCCKIWFVWITQLFHGTFHSRRHTVELRMIDPVSNRVGCQRKTRQSLFVYRFVQLQKDCEARTCQNGVRPIERNVVVTDVSIVGGQEAIRCQE